VEQFSQDSATAIYRYKWWTMVGVGLGILMATLDISIVNISLPTLVKELNTDFVTIQWVAVGYVLVLTSLMLGAARMADIVGPKKVYLVGLTTFTLGSLLCGASPSVYWLIGFRVFQGLGAAMTQAVGMAIITAVFPPYERGRALGISGGIIAFGLAMGPAMGGLIIGLAGWRWVFLVNVPIGLLAGLVIWRHTPHLRTGQYGQRFDAIGAFLLLVTLLSLALAMTVGQRTGFTAPAVLGLLTATVVGLFLFVILETRVHQPMIDLTIFRDRLFSLNLVMGFLTFVMNGGILVLPFFLELVMGYSTQRAGLFMMAAPVSMGMVSPWAGTLSDKHGSRLISLIGLLVLVGGCLAVGTLDADVSGLGYLLRVAPIGIGMGLFQAPNNSAVMGRAPQNRLGVASGLLSLSRTLGTSTGLPLMGALFTTHVTVMSGLSTVTNLADLPHETIAAAVAGTYRTAALFGVVVVILAWSALRIGSHDAKGMHTYEPHREGNT
jgi:EmrB/QacA subfamily drug resistance transporter